MTKKGIYFKDVASYDAKTKRVVLCRDGISEYQGHELGLTGDNKVYRVFKPKSFVDFVNKKINDLGAIPIFINHPNNFADLSDDLYYKKGGVGNTKANFIEDKNICEGEIVAISEDVKDLLKKGREVSLGYRAYIKHSNDFAYDFIHDIYEVNHLAIAPDGVRGRCGSVCAVLDTKESYKKFILKKLSEDGSGDEMDEKEKEKLVMDTKDAVIKEIKDLEKSKKEADEKKKSDKSDNPDDKEKEKKKTEGEDMKEAEKKAYDKGYADASKKFGKKVSDTYQNAIKLVSVGFLKVKDLIDNKPCEIMLDTAKKTFGNEDIIMDTLQPYIDLAIKKGNEKSWNLKAVEDLNKESDSKNKKTEDKKTKNSLIDIV